VQELGVALDAVKERPHGGLGAVEVLGGGFHQ
jgi:hypothetical protein